MILFNRDVLFVHNPKTAGTSLLAALEKALPDVRKAGVDELGTHHPHLDLAMGYACGVTGNRPQDFKRILVGSREAVDRERSMYAHFKRLYATPSAFRELNDEMLLRCIRYAGTSDPDGYIQSAAKLYGGHCDVWFSRHYYRGGSFERPRLSILRIAHLAADLNKALDGVDHAPFDVPHVNTSGSEDVEFSQRSLDIIRRSYAWMDVESIPV